MDKYEKIRLVGRGASGTVYLYRRKSNDRLVIIKQIPVEQMSKSERLSALNEGKVLSMLQHPNIIEYFESFLQDKAMMIIMEYAKGGTLYDFLQQRDDNLLKEEEILHLFVQILLSLQHVHSRQILHRDLKTQNILLNKHKNIVKIGDFGISKILSSKSKAYTVVGTPCYISPELCEGKPYNQKSDIWALGCILYEIATLKRAFEAATLPALILKILSGSVAPLPDQYSDGLKQLVASLLHLDPNRRPSVAQIMAQPIVMNIVANFYTDFGMIPSPAKKIQSPSSMRQTSGKFVTERLTMSSNDGGVGKSSQKYSVFCWGGGITSPVSLPNLFTDSDMSKVTVGRTQKLGLTSSGHVILWEESPEDYSLKCKNEISFIPRSLEGLNALTIVQVVSRDLFTVCLTDRGILLTFGNNVNGCLGHGDDNDLAQPRIVESLLGFEVIRVACGSSHVVAITNDNEIFSWGCGHDGRLGLGSNESYSFPQKVLIRGEIKPRNVFCATDCSVILTVDGEIIACGHNRDNKLWLGDDIDICWHWRKVSGDPWNNEKVRDVALGTSHSALITQSGKLFMTGSNQFDQLLGDEEKDKEIKLVSCGDAFTIAITTDDKIFCWGKHSRGRLGCARNEQDCAETIHEIKLTVKDNVEIVSIDCAYGNTMVLANYMS